MQTRPLADWEQKNFQTLLRAAEDGNLALMSGLDAETGEHRAMIVAIAWDGAEYQITPFGHLATGNPFEQYIPASAEDGTEPQAGPEGRFGCA